MRKKIVLMLSGVVGLSCLAQAQDSLKTQVLEEAVVTGTKFEIPTERSGKVIFKLGQEQLQTGRPLADVLNEVPGIQMDGIFGTPGTNISYYVRGGRSKNSLILLDGIPMNDPSGIDPFFDVRFLSTDQIGTVEVLQGSLSTLYGSGASASVINIQTKNLGTDGIHGSVDLNAGSWNSFGQNLNLNGTQGKFSFQFLGNNSSSTGFSAAFDANETGNFDDDGFKRRNGFLKLGYQVTENFKLDFFGGVDWFDADFDEGAFIDGNNTNVQTQRRMGARGTLNYNKGSVTLTAQHTGLDRELEGSYSTEYEGSTWFAEVIHKHKLNSYFTILDGISFQDMSYGEKNMVSKDSTSFSIIDPYASILLGLPSGLNIHAGVRLNNHSVYGSKFLYNVNPSWTFSLTENVKIKPFVSVSTSFITPTLFQLYTPWGGNKDLQPEESFNTEYGVSFFAFDKLNFTVVNFFRKEEDVIGYLFQYENLADERNVKGITFDVQYSPIQVLTLTGNFSWVTSDTKSSFYRIPEQKAGLGLQVRPTKTTDVSVRYSYTGERTDLYFDEMFVMHEVELSSYNLLDVSVTQKLIHNHLFLYGSVYNLTDEDFVGVSGYTTRGRNFTVGLKYSF